MLEDIRQQLLKFQSQSPFGTTYSRALLLKLLLLSLVSSVFDKLKLVSQIRDHTTQPSSEY